MILNLDVTNKEFVVTKDPSAKVDQSGNQRVNKATGEPRWVTEVVVTDISGGEIININTVGSMPDVQVGDELEVTDLVAVPWASNGRTGIAYQAAAIKVAT